MSRLLLPTAALLVAVLAGCGSTEVTPAAPTEVADAPSAAAGPPGGIPALSGDPADLTQPTQAAAGTGSPPTELLVEDVVVGTGTPATEADSVDVRYTGTLYSDGSVFDSSWERGDAPINFPLNQVVPGFTQGIVGMAPGGRRVIVMPPELAYGSQARPGLPANSTLVFVVDLVGIS
ncbi:FKBP-type peptidyl-prolyl cis-trans isomerase [Pseudonocardia sp.]|uniref:FKBP-type peptidyl-prolyl cis-trans isomerase n=1 Tax=Pseudonocardia sp. TaxID=60912 RepID=UPI0026363011|nr:FKBP-type peptidyl-prolyl cis-trans isomerase [Pseudonocardia sp.]